MSFKQYLYKQFLPLLFSKKCESLVPRSGKEGARVNCYMVSIDKDGKPYFIANSYTDEVIIGLKWNGNSYKDNHSMSLDEFVNGELRITHYYGLSNIIYNSIYDLTRNYITKYAYLKIHINRFINKSDQYLFNRRKLVTKKRMELLIFMMEDQLYRDHDHIPLLRACSVSQHRFIKKHAEKLKDFL